MITKKINFKNILEKKHYLFIRLILFLKHKKRKIYQNTGSSEWIKKFNMMYNWFEK